MTATNFILENAPEDRTVDLLTEQLAVSIFGTSGDVGAITSDNILVTVDLADFGSAVGTYTVPAEVTVVGHDVGVSGGTYQVRVTISEQTSDQPAEPDTPAGEIPDTGHARASNPIGARPGQKVVVESSTKNMLRIVVLVYLIPVVLFLAGYVIMSLLTDSVAAQYAVAAAGFAAGIVFAIFYDRRLRARGGLTFNIVRVF